MTQITQHFTLEEFCGTSHVDLASQNLSMAKASPSIMSALQNSANMAEKVRAIFNAPMNIHSGYRCPALNAAVGSNPNSQHLYGQAFDFDIQGMDFMTTFNSVAKSGLPFHQLLIENGCVHFGCAKTVNEQGETAYWNAGVKSAVANAPEAQS